MFAILASGLFFTETLYPEWQQQLQIEHVLYEGKTDYQSCTIFENQRFGKVLALDGVVQTTEADHAIYAEMLVHVPFLAHGNVKNVLIIGGGDGSILREVLRYNELKMATLVEIDPAVIDLTKKWMPDICKDAFNDPRVSVHVQDAAKYISESNAKYDVIICDTTDPLGPGAVLFTKEFYGHCKRCLTPNGILVNQNGVPFLQKEELTLTYDNRKPHFQYVGFYLVAMPTYIGGFMALGFASDNPNHAYPSDDLLKNRFSSLEGTFLYYTPRVHKAAFELPAYLSGYGDYSLFYNSNSLESK